MTTATVDPAVSIAAAGHQLFEALREMVDRGEPDDVPTLLDELSKLLRSARGKVARASKRAEPKTEQPNPPTPAASTAAADRPAATSTLSRETAPAAKEPSSKAITVSIPDNGSDRRAAPGVRSTQPSAPERATSAAATASEAVTTRPMIAQLPQRARRWVTTIIAVGIAVALIIMLVGCGSSPAPTPVPAANPSVTVLERSCLYPDDAELNVAWMAEGPGGLQVELWCGSRVEVSAGICRVRLGDELTDVPCREP